MTYPDHDEKATEWEEISESGLEVAETPDWLRTDEREDVIDSLGHALLMAGETHNEPNRWKWVLIAVHLALQGALVNVLSGTDETGALDKRSIGELRKWFDESRTNADLPYPVNLRLADLDELYKRAKKAGLLDSLDLRINSHIGRDIRRLRELRREFEHFTPKGWSIETAGLPRIVNSVVMVIEVLVATWPRPMIHLSEEQVSRTEKLIRGLKSIAPPT